MQKSGSRERTRHPKEDARPINSCKKVAVLHTKPREKFINKTADSRFTQEIFEDMAKGGKGTPITNNYETSQVKIEGNFISDQNKFIDSSNFVKRKVPIYNQTLGIKTHSAKCNKIKPIKQTANNQKYFQKKEKLIQEFDVNLQELSAMERNLNSIQIEQLLPTFQQNKESSDNFIDPELQQAKYPILTKKEQVRLYNKIQKGKFSEPQRSNQDLIKSDRKRSEIQTSNNTLSIYKSIIDRDGSLASSRNTDLWKAAHLRNSEKNFYEKLKICANQEIKEQPNNKNPNVYDMKVPIDSGFVRSDGFYKGRNEAVATKSKDRLKKEKDKVINNCEESDYNQNLSRKKSGGGDLALLVNRDKLGLTGEFAVLRKKGVPGIIGFEENGEKQKEQILIEIGNTTPKNNLHNYIRNKMGNGPSKVSFFG